ncbi:MAG: arylsulfatase [Rikenella sp.]|nr:arylsulfatase [Rikenella sp.]
MIQPKLNLALLSALALGSAGAQAATPVQKAKKGDPRKPNVVVILADDLGFGDIACNGSEHTVATPNVDRLAAEGVRFEDAHATAATSTPARYSILTGEYAWRRPGTGIAPGDAAMIVTPQHRTLPGMMQRAGYTTAAVGKWHLGLGDKAGAQDWNGVVTPGLEDIGFDYSYIMAATADRVPCVYIENGRVVGLDLENHPEDSIRVSYNRPFPGEPTGRKNPELLKLQASHGHDMAIVNGIGRIGYMTGGGKALWVDENIADTITERAVRFIEREAATENPFFLYFCTNDVHVPRAPHERFAGRSGMGARGDAILQFDWSVGRILGVLDSLGIADNTLVILSSDNGPVVDDGYRDRAVELLGEHRPWGRFRGGKYSIFEAGTRIPAIVRWPKHVPAGRVSHAAASQVDWFASLAALVGQELAEGEAPDSRNHLATWLGKERKQGKGREYIVENAGTLSITVDGWKYIAPSGGAAKDHNVNIELGNSKEPQLYYLIEDIGERNNLAAQYPERVAELAARLEEVRRTPDRR